MPQSGPTPPVSAPSSSAGSPTAQVARARSDLCEVPGRAAGSARWTSHLAEVEGADARARWRETEWKDRLKEKLHDAQVALLEKIQDRRNTYGASSPQVYRALGGTAAGGAAGASLASPLLPVPEMPGCGSPSGSAANAPAEPCHARALPKVHSDGELRDEGASPLPHKTGRRRAHSLVDFEHLPEKERLSWGLTKKVSHHVNRGMAYMGVDWYTMGEKQKKLSYLFFIQNLYYWCYAGYVIFAVVGGALLIWLIQPEGGLTLAQSVYSAAACVSQSGLAVVDWSTRTRGTYIVSFCLIVLGSGPLLHCVPVILRESSFRMQAQMTKAMSRKYSPAEEALARGPLRRRVVSEGDAVLGPAGAEAALDPAAPGAPGAPLLELPVSAAATPDGGSPVASRGEAPAAKRATVVHFPNAALAGGGGAKESLAKRSKCSDALSDMHRLEYKALRVVLKIVLGYWLCVHALGFLVIWAYFVFPTGPIQDKFQKDGLVPHWHAAYLTVSAFQNNGLVMTPSSVMDFARSPILLNTIGALVLLGNTGLPIMVRLIATLLERHAVPGSERQRILDFLLEHPRRCFTHMFPAVHTLWLLLVVITLNVATTFVIIWQDSDSLAFSGMDPATVLWNALFQAVSTRTAGLNSVNIAYLSQGTTFLLAVMMYLASTPTVVTMRLSAVVGAGGHTELDITGRVEGVEEEIIKGDNSLKTQARRYLTQDITYLTLSLFLICVLEKHQFTHSAQDISPDSDGIYGDFTFFKVLFELASAYGTCGLSLGFQNQTASFSGVWSTQSQMLLVLVMILGRLRGLPDSIDPSVRMAMARVNGEGALEERKFVHA